MDISTIIVSYNTFDLTREAIRSALLAADGLDHEVIVVDNDSPDQSYSRLRDAFPNETYPNVQLIASTSNLGFSKANNLGAELARGDVLFFLNPDTIVHENAISTIHDFVLSHPEAGAVGPRVLNTDGTVQRSTSPLPSVANMIQYHLPIGALFNGFDQNKYQTPTKTGEAEIINGCALAIRSSVFHDVGQWDEAYFMYSEETELCGVLIRKGYTNYFVHEAVISHYGGASTWDNYAEQQVVQQRSTLQYLRRHHRPLHIALHRVTGAIGFGARVVAFRVLQRLDRNGSTDFKRRGDAASRLFGWFLTEYS